MTPTIIFIDSPVEQTTAATDVLLAIISVIFSFSIYHVGRSRDSRKTLIWVWVFALLGVASVFGAMAHGISMSEKLNFIFWQFINLSLGFTVALFVTGVVYDLRKFSIPLKLVAVFLSTAVVFYLITLFIPGSFFVFIIYEAIAMIFALISYLALSIREKQRSYWFMTVGIFISILSSIIQATEFIRFSFIWEFDHNGTFHLVQIIGLGVLMKGLRLALLSNPSTKASE
jgi:hypothetical protein